MPLRATSMTHLGVEVWVECEGAPVPVYNVEITEEKATCWIASEAGKGFAVKYKPTVDHRHGKRSGDLFVDGTFVNGKLLSSSANTVSWITSVRVGNVKRNLYFSALNTSDDDKAVKDNTIISGLGTIELKIQPVRVTRRNAPGEQWDVPTHLDATQFTVHERAKKLGGHHVTLGAPQIANSSRVDVELEGDPLVIFEFKYRPKEILQAQDIILVEREHPPLRLDPPAQPAAKRRRDSSALGDSTNTNPDAAHPSKKSRHVKDEAADGDPEALRARIRALEAELAVHRGDEAKVKVEQIHASRFFTDGQVIDLTDD